MLLAANMRGRLPGSSLKNLISSLDTSNASGVEVLIDCGATAMTDVSGFGLAGHLSEMTRASGLGADVELSRVPQLTEALSLLEDGVFSSLQANNLQALVDYTGVDEGAAAVQLLADPQTAGGMLAGIPADRVTECLMRLNEAGYTQAAVIGSVTAAGLRLLD